MKQVMHRTGDGQVKSVLSEIEGLSFVENPLDFFLILARYKFAMRFLKKSDVVLDVGCGLGIGGVLLSKSCKSVTAIDQDEDVIKKNMSSYSSIANLSFSAVDLTQGSTLTGSYDAVVAMDVIEHIKPEFTNTFLSNISSLTKDDGFAVIGTPNIHSQQYASAKRKESHYREFEPDELQDILEKYYRRVFLFSMTDETISTSFSKMAWYLIALCVK